MDKLIYNALNAIGFGHPLHPTLTHLVIGPVVASLVFSIMGWIWKKNGFWQTARYLTVFSFVFWFFTVGFGIIDWIHFYNAASNIPEIRVKFILATILFVTLLATIIINRKSPVDSKKPFPLYVLAFLLVVGLGFAGGNLAYGPNASKLKSGTEHGGATGSNAPVPSTTADGFKEFSQDGYTLDWKIDGSKLDVRASYAGTGWVGVGFGHTGEMQGSTIYIGYVKDGQAVIKDTFGNALNTHSEQASLGSRDLVSNAAGSLINGVTTLSFTIPLDAGDKTHVVLSPGQTYDIIMAHGPQDAKDDTSYHGPGAYTSFQITL